MAVHIVSTQGQSLVRLCPATAWPCKARHRKSEVEQGIVKVDLRAVSVAHFDSTLRTRKATAHLNNLSGQRLSNPTLFVAMAKRVYADRGNGMEKLS